MSRDEFRAQLWSAVENHPATMTDDATERMRRLIDEAAGRLAAEPDRTDEARRNLQRFLDRASESGGGAEAAAMVDEEAVSSALRGLCPIFPIC